MFKFFKEKLQNLFKTEEKLEKEPEVKKQKSEKKTVEKSIKSKKEVKLKEKQIKSIQESKKDTVKEENYETKPSEHIIYPEPEEKSSFFDRFKRKKEENTDTIEEETIHQNIFSKIQSKFNTVKLDQETFNRFFENLEMLMLENNVALEVVEKIRDDMEKRLVNIEVKKDKLEEEIKNSLKESIQDILIPPFDIIEKIKKKEGTFIILFFGINGSGKTTTISKIAYMLKQNRIPCVLAAGDTFRAASIEQLQKHGENLEIKVIHQTYGSDPSAVAFDAIKYAEAHKVKVVLIDTAGRMHTKDNLLKEMEKIVRVTKPDLKIFVAESITGNDATEQAKIFNEVANIDGTILTKADVDEKGGTAISIGYVTKKPILFLGTGQEYKDLTKFDPKEILVNLGL